MITYQICLNGNMYLKLNFFKFSFSSLPDILKILLLDLNISEEVKLCPVAVKKYFAEYLIYNVSMIHHIHFSLKFSGMIKKFIKQHESHGPH